MGMGIPMVVSMPAGEATEIVCKSGAGIIVKPEHPKELATAIALLCDNPRIWRRMSQKAYIAAQLYSRESMAQKMLKSFENIIR